jgi:Flp pilus assembly protein TadG
MTPKIMRVSLTRLGSKSAGLRRDERGVAAVEFGLLVPLLFVMFIGTLELGQAVGLDRRVSMATAATADLIARDKTASDSSLDGTMQIINQLLKPYDPARMKVAIISVKADPGDATRTRVEWSKAYNGATVPAKCADYAMPTGLLSANSSAIIVESEYDYEPLILSHYLNSAITLRDKATVSPRNACVVYNNENDNCILNCP